ncbi:uncharacterized protein N7484_000899 [Penicillium longicatenatum]|uniref:uncharacterized protein n=1 Tax=Penicillium longicatenatum TaxID=1561947 RepID=UPI00254670CA|nr:uncharacterized protein N7484_000899 [Penicillium longicatenatum]KAJ5657250.1 hypothetical protein N7484_000899 [Penicillium longicatenatum]
MDPHQSPQPLSDSRLWGTTDTPENSWIPDDITKDWNALNDFYFCSSEPTSSEWPWIGHAAQPHETFDQAAPQAPDLAASDIQSEPFNNVTAESLAKVYQPQPQNLANVPQWLDGAYRPPVSCRYCRKYRLQCLILRTTSANPNPVSACSSCVALFRECSLAKGEKRLPSGFETFAPVLGHLHGLPEHPDDSAPVLPSVENIEEQRESKQFVRKGARVLREWFYQNQERPYPTEEQKIQFSRETGFSEKRVATWFANARRRQKQKMQSSNLAANTRTRAGSPLITNTLISLTPMERWKASPPEDEAVPESVIQDAIASTSLDMSMDPFQFDGSAMDLFNFDESSSHLPSSASSFGSWVSETSDSVSSAWSQQSGEGSLPFPMLPKPSRSRRRDHSKEHQYQCTFCMRSFKKRHDWARHEKSVHFSLEIWICTPSLDELQQAWQTQGVGCNFCDVLCPGPAHLEEHEFHICATKPMVDRSFTRKDYLWQHLRKFHGCSKNPVPDLEAWRATGAEVQSRCGFCGQSFSTWTARAEHLADHFKNGVRMNQWVGDWGLSPTAMDVLRKATLPNQRSLAA